MSASKRKNYEQKKGRITSAAGELFIENGYAQTSVDDIIKHLEISKGTFYHYYTNKLELLDDVVGSMVLALQNGLSNNAEDPSLSALEKINSYFSLPAQFRSKNKAKMRQSFKVWNSVENTVFRNRLIEALRRGTVPFVQDILVQGNREKKMNVEDPEETAFLLFDLGVTMRNRIMESIISRGRTYERLQRIVDSYRTCIERMLCLAEGSLHVIDITYFR